MKVMLCTLLFICFSSSMAEVSFMDKKKFQSASMKCEKDHETSRLQLLEVFSNKPADFSTKCYLECIGKEFGLVHNGSLKKDVIQSKIQSLPEGNVKQSLLHNMEACLDKQSGNICDQVYNIVVCFSNGLKRDKSKYSEYITSK